MNPFHPKNTQTIIFDLNSIASDYSQESWSDFEQTIRVLSERDYKIVLLSNDEFPLKFKSYYGVSTVLGQTLQSLNHNPLLLSEFSFWITSDEEIQTTLAYQHQSFAGNNALTEPSGGIYLPQLRDLLHIFHPSQHTAVALAEIFAEIKHKASTIPLTIGVGGPDDCGHAFFVETLIETLEDQDLLVAGLDLTEVLSIQFKAQSESAGYWRSETIRQWAIQDILYPYAQGERVFIEKAPTFMEPYDTSLFPLFLAPEMVLVVWGTSLFIPDITMLDFKILLEMSPKAAAARLYGIDDRENFDPTFLQTYEANEGKLYQAYLIENDVNNTMHYVINFDNFNAFRFKS